MWVFREYGKNSVLAFILGTSIALNAHFARADVPEDARRAIALCDYIGSDYANAVSADGGTIRSGSEYNEMVDFVSLVDDYTTQLSADADASLLTDVRRLKEAILNKANVAFVREAATRARQQFVTQFSVSLFPPEIPDLALGRKLYTQSCAICHGESGRPSKEIAARLEPPPRTLADGTTLDPLSPFRVFNSITFGIEGTAMPSFSSLTEHERWSLAAVPFTLRSDLPSPTAAEPSVPWTVVMQKTDEELLSTAQKDGMDRAASLAQLSRIRHLIYSQRFPSNVANTFPKKSERSALAGIERAIRYSDRSLASFQKNKMKEATDEAVSAYLDGFESAEAVLRSTRHADLVRDAEKSFTQYRKALRGDPNMVATAHSALMKTLRDSETTIRGISGLSPWAALLGSFFIIGREGLEAVLLGAVILSGLAATNAGILLRWFHASWIAALICGGLTWIIAQEVVTGSVREGMEGWISFLAAAVLIYVSFWLFSKRDAATWKRYLVEKVKGRSGVGIATVVSMTFLAVYREVFETVLFVQALKLQAENQLPWIIAGGALGILVLLVTTWVMFRLGKRIPLKHFFGTSSLLLCLLAIVFLGEGVHSLQEANLLSEREVRFITIPSLGIYPYLEGLIAQTLLLFVFAGAWVWDQMRRKSWTHGRRTIQVQEQA
ncbi:MAG TPA: cytochrome c/FTR1 family iron permease [Bdellovibrionota bacterium]|nr:cytochrome c/FTR1 family iron permease [Bdellovibrionota bacterium]